MPKIKHNLTLKQKRKLRVRSKLFGTALRPRLSVLRSNKHIALQVIDDEVGKTLISASDFGKKAKVSGTKTEKVTQVSADLAKQLKTKKINKLVFDRSYYKYHGRVKAVAEALREAGIEI